MRPECQERFPRYRLHRKPDPGMHHGYSVTQVPCCMSGLLTRGGGENVPDIPAILRSWQKAHGKNGSSNLVHVNVHFRINPILIRSSIMLSESCFTLKRTLWSAHRNHFVPFTTYWALIIDSNNAKQGHYIKPCTTMMLIFISIVWYTYTTEHYISRSYISVSYKNNFK